MKIRSITIFTDPGWPLDEEALKSPGEFLDSARDALEGVGYDVQTTRMATSPFPRFFTGWDEKDVLAFAVELDGVLKKFGIDYLSLGPALPDVPESYLIIPQILSATENVFLSGVIASPEDGISLPAIRACGEVICAVSQIEEDGFGNLYFGALANVSPGTPFFPAAYHRGGSPAFAIATEAADLAVIALNAAEDLLDARQTLIRIIEQNALKIEKSCRDLERKFNVAFNGIDFTLAPFPDESCSIGTALERLGVHAVGYHGSLAGTAFLADTVDRAHYTRVGFSGLFFPLLEDEILAKRAREGEFTVTDLLLYATVCGTGLDTIPLPGDTTPDEIAALLLDIAALSQRLGKPLTARLLPVPGKKEGDMTEFDFPYFANSRVLGLRVAKLRGLFSGSEAFDLQQYSE